MDSFEKTPFAKDPFWEFPNLVQNCKPGCLGPATTQNLVVKFDGEICGGVLVENVSDDFPQ